MTKKKVDYSTAGLSILGVKTTPSQKEDQAVEIASLTSSQEPLVQEIEEESAIEPTTEKPIKSKKKALSAPKTRPAKLISRTYYITLEQYKAIKMREAVSNNPQDKDKSAIVRAALDRYLAKELKDIKNA